MTASEVKAWMEMYVETLRRVFRAEEALTEAQEQATSIGAKLGDGLPRAHGVKSDLSDYIVRAHELAQRAAVLDARAEVIADGICDEISMAGLSMTEMRVLVERYLKPVKVDVRAGGRMARDGYRLQEWSKIAQKLGCTQDQIYKVHGKALAKVANSRTRWEQETA